MALQFDPSPYLRAFQYGRDVDKQNADAPLNSASNLGSTLGQIGQKMAQIPAQQRQARMQQLLDAKTLRDSGVNVGPAMDWVNTGRFPSAPSVNSDPSSSMPSPSPTPMFGGSKLDLNGNSSGSPVIDAWKNHPDLTQFAPKSPPSGQPAGFGALLANAQPSLKDRLTQSEIAKNNADAQSKNAPDSMTPVSAAVAMFPSLKSQQAALEKEFPNGMSDKHLTLIAQSQKSEAGSSEKQAQADKKRWDAIIKDTDPYKASSRSALGMATIGNQRANRAIPVLQNPNATNQDISTAIADISGIFQGGIPTDAGQHAQEYNTLAGRLSNLKTLVTGQPSAPAIPEVKAHLLDLINTLKDVNNQSIKDQLDYTETAYPDLIQKNQMAWQGIRKRMGVDQAGSQSPQSGQLMYQGRPLRDTPANRAWLAQQQQGGAQ